MDEPFFVLLELSDQEAFLPLCDPVGGQMVRFESYEEAEDFGQRMLDYDDRIFSYQVTSW